MRFARSVMAPKSPTCGRTSLAFHVAGAPLPQPRPRFVMSTGRTYYPREILNWKRAIWHAASDALGKDAPLPPAAYAIYALFKFARPLSHFVGGKRTNGLRRTAPLSCANKCDIDNLLKALQDALLPPQQRRPKLTKSGKPKSYGNPYGIIADDKYIVEAHAAKEYVCAVEDAGVDVFIEKTSPSNE